MRGEREAEQQSRAELEKQLEKVQPQLEQFRKEQQQSEVSPRLQVHVVVQVHHIHLPYGSLVEGHLNSPP